MLHSLAENTTDEIDEDGKMPTVCAGSENFRRRFP